MLTVHIAFFLLSFVVLGIVILAATGLKFYLPKYNFAYMVISAWAMLINILFLCDFLELSVRKTLAILAGIVLFTIILGYIRLRESKHLVNRHSLKTFATMLICWGAALSVLTLPLVFGLPKSSVISGHFISNDSVMHAIMSRGFVNSRELDIPSYYNDSYPRGFHSFIFYASTILQTDPQMVMIPAVIFGYAMLGIVVCFIARELGIKKSAGISSLALLAASPFLVTATLYHLFVPQVVVAPLLITAVFVVMQFDFRNKWLASLGLLGVLALAMFNIYGVFPISVLLFAIAVRLGWLAWDQRGVRLVVVSRRELLWIGSVASVLLMMSVPALSLVKNMFSRGSGGGSAGDLLTSVGNLPDGFLSVFHLVGTWPSSLQYRDSLTGQQSYFAFFAMGVFALHLFFLFRMKWSKKLLASLLVMMTPAVASLFILANPYIQFKYYTFVIPVYLFCVGVAIIHYFEAVKWGRWLAVAMIGVLVAINVLIPLRSYRLLGVVFEHQFSELSLIDQRYTEQGKTLFLTLEDWAQYYRDDSDDFVPLTTYVPKAYTDGDLDYVVVDVGYQDEVNEYLKQHSNLKAQMDALPGNCIDKPLERYAVYKLKCEV